MNYNIINHPAFINLYLKDKKIFTDLFSETKSLKTLTIKIVKASKNYKELSYIDAEKVKGDLFEVFAECFFKLLSSDNRVGIYNYYPEFKADFGVDGYGVAINDHPATVQVKFRANQTEELTLKDIKNFQGNSYRDYGVPVNSDKNLILFTNAKGLHWITEAKVLSGASKTFGYSEISSLVDNNTVFWKNVSDLTKNTLAVKFGYDVGVDVNLQ